MKCTNANMQCKPEFGVCAALCKIPITIIPHTHVEHVLMIKLLHPSFYNVFFTGSSFLFFILAISDFLIVFVPAS